MVGSVFEQLSAEIPGKASPHSSVGRHSPAQAASGWSAMRIQVRVILPGSPSASANDVNGMRQRWAGSVNHWRQIVHSLSSRALLVAVGLFGLPVRLLTECRGKPHVICCMMRCR